MKKWRMVLIATAVIAVPLSLINASWIAPKPGGKLILVAHHGVSQQFDHEGIDNSTCTATRILPPEHLIIDNTLFAIDNALQFGANGVALPVHPTKDGRMVVFHDWTLDCRTEGTGPVREHDLAALKRLDVGYGYTADRGKTFPLRGRGVGGMPTVEEVLRAHPTIPIIFTFKSRDPRDADVLIDAFARAGVKIDGKYGFTGVPAVTGRLKARVPDAWVYGKREPKACLTDYAKWGWTGVTPASCRDTTVVVPLNYQWAIWGWPNRFLARMAKANSRVILYGDYRNGGLSGLNGPAQLGDVPRDYRGYLWVEDIYAVGRALGR